MSFYWHSFVARQWTVLLNINILDCSSYSPQDLPPIDSILDIQIEPPHNKTNKMTMRTTKTQISLSIHPVWSESSLCTQWVAKDPRFLHADSEDSDQTGWMPRLIWVFAGRITTLLVLSCRGSIIDAHELWGKSHYLLDDPRTLSFRLHLLDSLLKF